MRIRPAGVEPANLLFRRQTLYPVELRALEFSYPSLNWTERLDAQFLYICLPSAEPPVELRAHEFFIVVDVLKFHFKTNNTSHCFLV